MRELFYFAYGNNMRKKTMTDRIGGSDDWEYYARARLRGYRLSFTTRTPQWDHELVADLTRDPRYSVYGVIYKVSERAFDCLAPHEPTYERVPADVDVFKEEEDLDDRKVIGVDDELLRDPQRTMSVEVYFVAEGAKEPDGVPSQRYLKDAMIAGAEERRLPRAYLRSLQSWRTSSGSGRLAVAVPTVDRGQKLPLPIVQVPKGFLATDRVPFVLVEYDGRMCMAQVQVRENLTGIVCGVDENVRVRLGVPAIEPSIELYGAAVSISVPEGVVAPYQVRVLPRPFHPRYLLLGINHVYSLDAEKDICVLDKATLDLLGGEVGDYVRISACTGMGEKSITRRAMRGETGRWDHPDDAHVDYPAKGAVHVDAADRGLLGLGAYDGSDYRKRVMGYPVLVSMSVWHLILKRLQVYLFSFLGASVALTLFILKMVESVTGAPAERPLAVLLLAFLIAGSLTATVVHSDISKRVRP